MGPLEGVRVVEVAGIGPGPFCAMLLADMGADVLRVDRASSVVTAEEYEPDADYLLNRGRRSIGLDLKSPDGVEAMLRLVDEADVIMEGFRPGVAERLGIGPEVVHARKPSVVYGRMTGWGQSGPSANTPGHDINYVALTGILHSMGRFGAPPSPPLNLIGDFGGGGMLLAFGIVCGLLEARASGQGQVIDAAMLDGAALIGTMLYGMSQMGQWSEERGTNLLDSGAHFYEVYETADGKYISIAPMEPKFYANLLAILQLDPADLPDQMDRDSWPAMKEKFAAIFREKTRDEWTALLGDAEVCYAPVLTVSEAMEDPQVKERGVFTEIDGVVQPVPAPRFSRTPGQIPGPPSHPGQHTDEALVDWGFPAEEIERLRSVGAIA